MDKKKAEGLAGKLTEELVKRRMLMSAGFKIFAGVMIPSDASQQQRDDMEFAFMAGAQHLFASIMTILEREGGDEPTAQDEANMEAIHAEMEEWRTKLKIKFGAASGKKTH